MRIQMEVAHKKEINVGEDIVTWANLVVQEVYVVQMASVLILVEGAAVITMESVIMEKMLITAPAIVDVTPMRYVSLGGEKPMEIVKIAQVIVEETTHAQEGGWDRMAHVNILSQGLIVPVIFKDPIGLERNVLALALYRI